MSAKNDRQHVKFLNYSRFIDDIECDFAIKLPIDRGIEPKIIKNCVGSHSQTPIPFLRFEEICRKNFGQNSIVDL